jgi:hypothetical protein
VTNFALMISKSVSGKNVFPRLDSHDVLKNGIHYVDARIAWKVYDTSKKKQVTKSIDVSIYLADGERLKTKQSNWSEGKIIGGYEKDLIEDLNHRIDTLTNSIVKYIRSGRELTKQLIEENIYPPEFLTKHKKKRTKNTVVKRTEREPTELLRELWKLYPRKRVTYNRRSTSVDEDGVEIIHDEEVTEFIDPLSLDNFPQGFPKAVYDRMSADLVREENLSNNVDPDLLRSLLKYYIESKFYGQTVTEVVELNKDQLKKIGKNLNHVVIEDIDHNLDHEAKDEAIIDGYHDLMAKERKALIDKLSIEERYKQGFKFDGKRYEIDDNFIDKNNIFQLLGICRFGLKYAEETNSFVPVSNYDYTWKNLMDYMVNGNPSQNIKDFDKRWVINFLSFMRDKGYIKQNNKLSSDLFQILSNSKEYVNRDRQPYTVNSFDRLSKGIKEYVDQLYQLQLIPHGFRKSIQSGKLHKFHSSTEYEAKFFITPSEFIHIFKCSQLISSVDKPALLHFLCIDAGKKVSSTDKRIADYGLTLKLLNDVQAIREILERTKDLFICQTLLGAMRISDFNDPDKTRLRKNTSYFFVKFSQRKTGGRVNNPVLKPVLNICAKYNHELPPRFSEAKYNKYLKLLFLVSGLNRPFIDERPSLEGGYNTITNPLHKAITNKFARATLVTLLTAYGVPDKHIMKWTGHKNLAVFLNHYQSILIDDRYRLSEKIMKEFLGKGYKEELQKEYERAD